MSQVNLDRDPAARPASGDRTAVWVNFLTALAVLAVLLVLAWLLFTGPLRSLGAFTPPSTSHPPTPPAAPTAARPPAPPAGAVRRPGAPGWG